MHCVRVARPLGACLVPHLCEPCAAARRGCEVLAIIRDGEDRDRAAVVRAEQAMKDPEIQAILQDPMVRQVIQDLSGGNGAAGQQAMNDPVMRGKIEKLIASGVLQTK